MEKHDDDLFVVVSVYGDNIPNYCWGPFTSEENARAWLTENGYERADLHGTDQGGRYFEKEFGGREAYVWIRQVQAPARYVEPYSHPRRLIT